MNPAPRQHTPGPWMASQAFFFGHDSLQITGTNGDTSPFLCRLVDDTPDYTANARLIAAAPELLDALERISTAYDETLHHPIAAPLLQAIYGARAAIAKATGVAL